MRLARKMFVVAVYDENANTLVTAKFEAETEIQAALCWLTTTDAEYTNYINQKHIMHMVNPNLATLNDITQEFYMFSVIEVQVMTAIIYYLDRDNNPCVQQPAFSFGQEISLYWEAVDTYGEGRVTVVQY